MAKVNFPKKLHPSGSLARRVVLVCLCLLVIPLFLHTLLVYQQEYRLRLDEVESLLETIGETQAAYLEREIDRDWQILDSVASDVHVHAKDLGIVQIFLPPGAEGNFTQVSLRNDALVIGKQIPQKKALAFSIPFENIAADLARLEKAPYPIDLALLNQNGKILTGKSPSDAVVKEFPIKGVKMSIRLSVPAGAVRGIHEREVIFRFLSLLVFVGVVGGFLVWILTRRVSRPLMALCKAMERVSEGAVHVRYTPDKMGFEINELGKQFNQTLDSLIQHQQVAERERTQREKLAEELRIGHEIQSSLLPTHIPELKGLEITPGFLPAREVGGDFYDLFLLENGKLFIAIADTAGKGVSACLYSLGIRSSLRSFASLNQNLSEIVLNANDLFWLDAKNSGMFVTLWAAIYDPETRMLEYCCQGHAPGALVRNGRIQELSTHGIALGAQKLDTIDIATLQMEEGDLLFLYTDGIIEAHDPDNQLFGSNRLREFLNRNHKHRCSHIIEKLIEEIHLFAQGSPQHDDLTALIIRISK